MATPPLRPLEQLTETEGKAGGQQHQEQETDPRNFKWKESLRGTRGPGNGAYIRSAYADASPVEDPAVTEPANEPTHDTLTQGGLQGRRDVLL